jgi:hypothetical protein
MWTNKKPLSLSSVFKRRKNINTQTDYQRQLVWSLAQKRLLIDTILRGYDIPKLYWRETGKNQYEVVDGQQRLNAIWSFMDNQFALGPDLEPVDGVDVSNLHYEDLPIELQDDFDGYDLDIVIIDTDEDEVREMFLRLQNGTSLKATEKRHAMGGAMRNFVVDISKHPFFNNCRGSNRKFMFEQIAAQMTRLELNGGSCNIKNVDLDKMYEDNKKFDASGKVAKQIRHSLDFLNKCFPTKTPELEWHAVISLYMIASELIKKYAITDKEDSINKWFIDFESYRRAETAKDAEDRDPEISEYNDRTGHSTDTQKSLQDRYEYLFGKLLECIPDIELLDEQRGFTSEQRLAIFRRDDGVCQLKIKCKGVKLKWGDEWHADHIVPWSKGGKTTVDNGQVACPACNLAKGAKMEDEK